MKHRQFKRSIIIGCTIMAVVLLCGMLVWIILPSQTRQIIENAVVRRPEVTCTTPHHATGDRTATIVSGGLERSFLIHINPLYGWQPQPLVLNFHGYSWTAEQMEGVSGMQKLADKEGFVVVFPQGSEKPPSWNAGDGAWGPTADADDVQFTDDLLNYMQHNYCVDAQRTYVTGFSLGGGMAYRAACDLSQRFAAVATVSGAYYPFTEGCQTTRPMAVMEIHGQADHDAPYDGYPERRMAAVNDYLNGWLTRDHCEQNAHTFFQKGDVTGLEWTNCTGGVAVEHYRVSDGGHSWPGSGGATHVIDASTVIWQFFSKYTLPTAK